MLVARDVGLIQQSLTFTGKRVLLVGTHPASENSIVSYTTLQFPTNAEVGDNPRESIEIKDALSLTKIEQVVHGIFADVSRALVCRDKTTPHRNLGEVLPAGVTSLLAELTIESTDLFLDIGAGLGKVVVHVVSETNAYKAIGIELRYDIHKVGLEMILKSGLQDVMEIGLFVALPYDNATIVYWNNVLFEPHDVEYVKIQLCGIPMVRYLVCFVNLCPRHRDLCSQEFCDAFVLSKMLKLPCSRKAGLHPVYIHQATDI
ncbi:Hypothetical protein PHPALM_7944 [Phytophthora palmivora]|uniref:DOT1 domain-containing protein n=1 Tax=Phytophthora palmivora TaxID=4796 RepID=A0A2P4YB09_9STRA|nr:Hypothetical protein PHPALM_7944 [Phytophthora palmivora]